MLTLYQFPISHYCEKARWALAYKGLDYRQRNLLPGPHVAIAKQLAPRSSVPILVHDGRVIQGSRDVISYLDANFPERSLTPARDDLRQEALEWERYVDTEIGVHLRRFAYHTLLDHPEIVLPLFTQGGPWYGKFLMKLMFPKLRQRMRQLMDINDDTAQQSREHYERAIDRLAARLSDRAYLVGDSFTRADLAAAALLAPLCRPDQYGLHWPRPYPEPLEQAIAACRPKLGWVDRLYASHR